MIADLLPATVASAELFGDADEASLFPEERAVIASSVAKRRSEFTAGRACARRALAKLGLPAVAILPGDKREPKWPDGIVGSITHCAGYRAAALAHAADVVTIGIDAEPHAALPQGVLPAVSLPTERSALTELRGADSTVHWDRLLFCAKESVYKAWFPLTARWLGFEDAHITLDPATHTFRARLLPAATTHDGRPLTGFDGRWLVRDGIVLAAIAMMSL